VAWRTIRCLPSQLRHQPADDVVALHHVLRCVDWAIKDADARKEGDRSRALRAARSTFDAAVPKTKDVRDILEHFDAYEQGKGGLQDENGQPELILTTEHDEESYRLTLMYGYTIDVGAACEAAATLTEDAMLVLDRIRGPE